MFSSIQTRLTDIRQALFVDTALVAVSKGHGIDSIHQAIAAGQFAFAENYLQEAIEKIYLLSQNHPPLEWHFIGPIQRNKTRLIAKHFAWVHSIDRWLIAKRLSAQRPRQYPPLQVCLQVNISQETTKSGVPVAELLSLAGAVAHLPHLSLRGIMVIPQATPSIEAKRSAFKQAKTCFEHIKTNLALPTWDTLSMGMSADFSIAVEEGATMVRIGSAIFGKRVQRENTS